MTAGRLIFPGMMPAIDGNGDVIAGALAYFYTDGTATLATVYSDSALSVALSNPVVADSLGVWPAMYADTATTFTVALTDANGVPLADATWSGFSSAIDATTSSVALSAGSASDAAASAASALGAPGTSATSTTSLTIGTGAKTFDLAQTGKTFTPGQRVVIASTADASQQMSGLITAFTDPSMTVSVDADAGSGTYASWNIALTGQGAVSSVAGLSGTIAGSDLKTAVALDQVQNHPVAGRQMLPVPASAMQTRNTNGAAVGVVETTTNHVMIRTLDFDPSTVQYAQFSIPMPKQWDGGTITAEFDWSHPSTSTNYGVAWAIQAVAVSDADALEAVFGTAQQVNDTGGATDTHYRSAETAAVTIAGTPQSEDFLVFQVYRNATDATNDTLAVAARLSAVRLFINTTTATDA